MKPQVEIHTNTEVTRVIVLDEDDICAIVAHFLNAEGDVDHEVRPSALTWDMNYECSPRLRYSWSQSS